MDGWVCTQCGQRNSGNALACRECFAPRPSRGNGILGLVLTGSVIVVGLGASILLLRRILALLASGSG